MRIYFKLICTSLILSLQLLMAKPAFAADPKLGTIDFSKLGVPTDLNQIIAALIQIAIAVAGIIFFFMLIFGGIRYLTAGGDEKATSAARQTLTNAFIGLIIIVAAFLITQLIFFIFQVPGVIVFTPNR